VGTLATQRASSSEVKQFGQRMVTDHSKTGRQWTALASKSALSTDVTLNPSQHQTADQLSRLSGAAFDQAYMKAMVENHDQNASTLRRIAAGAQSAEVKALATSGVTATEGHLAAAQQLAARVGATAAVATSSPTSPANAGEGRRTGANRGNQADGEYAQELAYDHILEVRLAKLAQKRAKNSEVKQFANQVAGDFPKWQERWTNLASKHGGVKVNPNMGPTHREKIDRLEKASARNFDQVYVSLVKENLGSIVPYLQKEGRDANAADIRSAVNDELPVIREKLNAVERLDRQVEARGKGQDKEKSLSDKQ
jgi:predicted outer membrane protein